MDAAPLETTLDCPACGEQRLAVMAVSAADPRLLLACAACGMGFWDPQLRERVPLERLGTVPIAASRAEARRAGWAGIVRD